MARAQPLVGVDQGVGHCRKALDMVQQTGNEGIGRFRQAPFPIGVVKDILAVFKQGHIQVHAVSGNIVDGFGHKGGVEAILLSNALSGQLEGHNLIRSVQSVGILEVNLMLGHGALVVAGLNLKSDFLQV